MGLITGLLTLPLAPVRGVAWVAEQVALEAERELDVEARLRAELGRLELEREQGALTEQEFEEREDALLDQLAAERRRRLEEEEMEDG
ncbi:MAG: gas vesicle protein GvpG [Thermoleophilaceae bacterium]